MGTRNTSLALTLSITALLGGCLSIEQPLGEDLGSGGAPELGPTGGTSASSGGMDECGGLDPDGTGGVGCAIGPDGNVVILNCGGSDPDGAGGMPAIDDCGLPLSTGGNTVDPCLVGIDPDGTGGVDCGTPATPGSTGGGMAFPCADGIDPDGSGGYDCGSPATSGGAMGTGGMGCGGYHDPDGTGGVPATDDCGMLVGAGGNSPNCGCMPSGELCTVATCGPAGECIYEHTDTGPDSDGDGFGEGCDCDDSDANVFPGQTAFFDVPVPSMPVTVDPNDPGMMIAGYDYDCDGYGEPRLNELASACRVLSGTTACTGNGWVNDSGMIPACGEVGLYRACQYQDGSCIADDVMSVQRCR